MDAQTARILASLTSDFYRTHAASFSATRTRPWEGWNACVSGWGVGAKHLSVLDLGCGNLRFEAFLAHARPDASITAYAVDNCAFPTVGEGGALAGMTNVHVVQHCVDVASALIGRACAQDDAKTRAAHARNEVEAHAAHAPNAVALDAAHALVATLADVPACDLSVAFGLLHHIPGEAAREGALRGLMAKTRPGGRVAVSLWRFLEDPAFAAKAAREHERAFLELVAARGLDADALAAALDPGDRLLGWQHASGACRYCHSFSDAEVDRLVASVAEHARLAFRFEADGRNGRMNTYLVFEMR